MLKVRLAALFVFIASICVGYFVYASETGGFGSARFSFSFGLDISGGTHLVYEIDTSALPPADIADSVESLRDVIERRVNLFGVSEPVVQVETKGFGAPSEREHRLIVELPGVTDLAEAKKTIGETPVLDFRTEKEGAREMLLVEGETEADVQEFFSPTALTGRFLENARVEFDHVTGEPYVSLRFTKEGGEIFAELTRENIGKYIAIYLDGVPISVPVVRDEIPNGQAQISGGFTLEEAKMLVGRLN
ncbi:MAG: protein translocase subunit SecD, partial [Candidatus Lloydbacteria bacterium CG22_combo_CG10-13_8_21_14_all_47_15]